MIALNIPEIKTFMAKLLTQNTFDTYLLREMELQTFTNYSITGQFNEEFFNKDELEARRGNHHILWSDVRSIAFSMIKGNKTPLSLKIVFQLSTESTEALIQTTGGRLRMEEVGGLYLNVRFEKGELSIITGTAIKTFTLDKTLEKEWDTEVKRFLHEYNILFEEK